MYSRKLIISILSLLIPLLLLDQVFAEEAKLEKKFEENELVRVVKDLKSTIVFLGELGGTVNSLVFLKIKEFDEASAKDIFGELIEKGYLDKQGNILNKFQPYSAEFTLELSDKFRKYGKEIITILEKEIVPKFIATGFLVKVQDIFHLVTAKHVVVDIKTGNPKDGDLFVFFNVKDGVYSKRSIKSIKEEFKINWIFHRDDKVDIALIPFSIDIPKDDVKVIDDKMFYSSDKLLELYEVLFLSYQPGIIPGKRISPIIRNGIISLINEDHTFYIDGFAFPGNSGSPVFIKFNPIGIDKNGNPSFVNIFEGLGIKFIGIIGEYLPYQEFAISTQTGRPRMVFEENTGLSKVWSVDFINQIIESSSFTDQLKQIKNNIQAEKDRKKSENSPKNPT